MLCAASASEGFCYPGSSSTKIEAWSSGGGGIQPTRGAKLRCFKALLDSNKLCLETITRTVSYIREESEGIALPVIGCCELFLTIRQQCFKAHDALIPRHQFPLRDCGLFLQAVVLFDELTLDLG